MRQPPSGASAKTKVTLKMTLRMPTPIMIQKGSRVSPEPRRAALMAKTTPLKGAAKAAT